MHHMDMGDAAPYLSVYLRRHCQPAHPRPCTRVPAARSLELSIPPVGVTGGCGCGLISWWCAGAAAERLRAVNL